MNLCGICKKPLDTGNVEDSDCGGDCLECMGTAGDPAAAKLFLEEIKKLRVRLHDINTYVLPVLRANGDQYFEALKDIRNTLEEHPDVLKGNTKVHYAYMKAKGETTCQDH